METILVLVGLAWAVSSAGVAMSMMMTGDTLSWRSVVRVALAPITVVHPGFLKR